MKTSIQALFILIAVFYIGRFQLMKIYYKYSFYKNSPETLIKLHQEEILKDREILSQYDVFRPSLGISDAGPYLNSKVHWQLGDIYHRGSLVLPEFVHKELNQNWINKRPKFKKMGLNFEWMNDLLEFDHWNPEASGPAYPAGKTFQPHSFPIPTYKDLLTWCKLRLLYGKERGDLISAFKEVRHLARLIWTNDFLLSSIMTISILQLEHDIHQGNWQVIPEEVLMRGKRYFYSLPGMTDIRLTNEKFGQLVETDQGICVIVFEGLMNYLSVRDLLRDDLQDEYERMNKLILKSQNKCRKTHALEMWKDKKWTIYKNNNDAVFRALKDHYFLDKDMSWGLIKKKQSLKAIIGYLLLAKDSTDHFGSYKK